MSKSIHLPFEYVQFLNQKVSENLHIPFHRHGDKLNFRCPICGDSRKSSTKMRGWWYSTSASYYCFNCGTGMSGIKFLELISGESYSNIRREYAKMMFKNGFSATLSADFAAPTDEPTIFQMKSVVNPIWKNPLSDKAKSYLDSRLVSQAPFKRGDLFTCYGKNHEEYILIPWTVNGVDAYYQLNDFQQLHGMKYIFPKAKKKLLYGLDNVDLSFPYIFLFEGVYDSLFVKNGVATGTKAITDYQLSLLKDRYPQHQLVVSFDNDAAGLESTMRLLKSDGDFRYFKWFNKNTKQKDINDYVLSRNDVNTFADEDVLKRLIVDKLIMKMYLIEVGIWKSERHLSAKKAQNTTDDTSTFWKTRKIF